MQTGAGKTFTCFGPSDDHISPGDPEEGLLGRSLQYLFEKLTDLNVSFVALLHSVMQSLYFICFDPRSKQQWWI